MKCNQSAMEYYFQVKKELEKTIKTDDYFVWQVVLHSDLVPSHYTIQMVVEDFIDFNKHIADKYEHH